VIGRGAKFGRKQDEAIAPLLTQRNVEEVARVTGVGAKQILRWRKVPEFQTAYRQERRAAARAAACQSLQLQLVLSR
jgi:hypothetical protein